MMKILHNLIIFFLKSSRHKKKNNKNQGNFYLYEIKITHFGFYLINNVCFDTLFERPLQNLFKTGVIEHHHITKTMSGKYLHQILPNRWIGNEDL